MLTLTVILGARIVAVRLTQRVVSFDRNRLLLVRVGRAEDWLDRVLALELVHGEHALLGVVGPEHVPLEHGEPVGGGDVAGTPHDVEPVLAVVVHSLDVVQEDVRPVDPLAHKVQRDPTCLVEGVGDESLDQAAVHVSSEDPVVVSDEHQAHLGVESDVGGRGEVAGHHDGLVVAADVEDVDLLAQGVHHVEVVRDPVHGNGHRRPGPGDAEIITFYDTLYYSCIIVLWDRDIFVNIFNSRKD